jgi:hypothetical protein
MGAVNRTWRVAWLTGVLYIALLFSAGGILATPIGATIEYQPMTSEGLAAGYPFEAWVVFDKSSDPSVPGYALPAGSTFRFTFPPAFTPQPGTHPESVLLYGWPQKAAPVGFTVGFDPKDGRTIVLKLTEPFTAGSPEVPGLKAIHLRWGPLNPAQAGDYPITVDLSDAGAPSGSTRAIAHITPKPVPVIAAYNQLHNGRNEDWQHVKVGQGAELPIDFLINLPGKARSSLSLRTTSSGDMEILSDETPIGTVTRRGVPVTLKPVGFGPGFARLGIIRLQVTAGSTPGLAEINAQLNGGASYPIRVFVEQ